MKLIQLNKSKIYKDYKFHFTSVKHNIYKYQLFKFDSNLYIQKTLFKRYMNNNQLPINWFTTFI
jgi:hypothetical protein